MSLEPNLSYYDLLEVTPSSGMDEIRSAYQRLRNFYLGDPQFRQNFSDAEIGTIISSLDEAFRVLNDPSQREAYDRAIKKVWPEPRAPETELTFLGSEGARVIPVEDKKEDLLDYYPIPSGGVDGRYLQRLREDSGISIEELGAITRIAIHHLESIESDSVEKLPAPVFVRGFIVQIAKTFGLNEKIVADSYMDRFNQLRKK